MPDISAGFGIDNVFNQYCVRYMNAEATLRRFAVGDLSRRPMTGSRPVSFGEPVSLRPGRGRIDDLHDAAVSARAERALSSAIEMGTDLGNVVPFMRPRGGARAAPEGVRPADVARLVTTGLARERVHLAAFAALSLGIHAGLFTAFWREPAPFASIGVEAISVEIMVGATAPAGVATTQGEQQVDSAAAPDPQRAPEAQAPEQPQEIQVATEEKAPEQKPIERMAERPKPRELETAADPEPRHIKPQPAIAMVESPKPEEATAKTKEIYPDTTEITLLPQPKEKPAEVKPTPKPVQAAPPKSVRYAAPAKERRRIEAPTRERAAKQAKRSCQ